MCYLSLAEALELHERLIATSGGTRGIRDIHLMETFLILNGFEIDENIDQQERIVLDVASGKLRREEFTSWLGRHITTRLHLDG